MTTSTGHSTTFRSSGVNTPSSGRFMHGGEGDAVVAGLGGVLAEQAGLVVVGIARALDAGEDPLPRSTSRSNRLRPTPDSTIRLNSSGRRVARRSVVIAPSEKPTMSTGRSGSTSTMRVVMSAYSAGSCGLGASPWPSRSTPMTSRPASASSSVNPLWRHVVSNDPPHPWTRTTGGISDAPPGG